MKPLILFSLFLLYLPSSGFAGVVYTYSGQPLSCDSTPCPADTYALNATLEFSSALAPDTKYVNPDYVAMMGGGAGTTDVSGLLTSWLITDGVNTISSAGSPLLFALRLDTDAAGSIAAWVIGARSNPNPSATLLLASMGTLSNASETSMYQVSLPGGTTDTTLMTGNAPGTWSQAGSGAVPEPATFALSGLAIGLAVLGRRRASR